MPSFQVNSKWACISELIPNLYICGVSALKWNALNALDINLMVNCTREVPNLNILAHCERIKLWLDDSEEADLSVHLDSVCDHIRYALTGGHRVLVHCVAGVSRSAAFCLAYLMKYENLNLRQAYTHMASIRPMVRPNLAFWKQLIAYESVLRPRKSASVRIVAVGKNQFLPDVYLPMAESEHDQENERKSISNIDLLEKRRHSSGTMHIRFVPRLASVPEN